MPKTPNQPGTLGCQMGKPSTGAAPPLTIPLPFLATGWALGWLPPIRTPWLTQNFPRQPCWPPCTRSPWAF